jgi:RNA polymerase sigma-70 factor (ECF subfamily)
VDAEQELVARAARSDAEAFRRIWTSHRDAVYRFACWMLPDRSAAEDIAQECFLSLLQHPERFQPSRGSLLTFLLAIARNQCRLRWRALEPEVPLEDDEEIQAAESLDPLEAAQSSAIVSAAVGNLPALQREALYLFEYQELSLEQAAAVAHCDIGTFKSRLYRARQRLRRELAWLAGKGLPNGTRS